MLHLMLSVPLLAGMPSVAPADPLAGSFHTRELVGAELGVLASDVAVGASIWALRDELRFQDSRHGSLLLWSAPLLLELVLPPFAALAGAYLASPAPLGFDLSRALPRVGALHALFALLGTGFLLPGVVNGQAQFAVGGALLLVLGDYVLVPFFAALAMHGEPAPWTPPAVLPPSSPGDSPPGPADVPSPAGPR